MDENNMKQYTLDDLSGLTKLIKGSSNSQDFIGGAGWIVASGPPVAPTGSINDLEVVGLLQSSRIDSSKALGQTGELGTHAKLIITNRGDKSINLGRLMTIDSNAVKQLYSWAYNEDGSMSAMFIDQFGADLVISPPQGVIWSNLDSEICQIPFGLCLTAISDAGDIKMQQYLENVLIQSDSSVSNEGRRGIIENFVVKWGNTVYINYSQERS